MKGESKWGQVLILDCKPFRERRGVWRWKMEDERLRRRRWELEDRRWEMGGWGVLGSLFLVLVSETLVSSVLTSGLFLALGAGAE